jgi:maltose O-acetyltransferase
MNELRAFLRRTYSRWFRPDPLDELVQTGLTVGRNFSMQSSVRIDSDLCWLITIGDDVTLAPNVLILAHDASTKRHLGYTRIGKVAIGDRVFIGASTVVLPGVCIGSDVVIGAGSVVATDIPDKSVAYGNPATVHSCSNGFLERKRAEMARVPCFGEEYTVREHVTSRMKAEMNERMIDRFGYLV